MLSLKLPQLLQVHQVPRFSPGERGSSIVTPPPTQVFWEDGIVSGYRRPTSSALDCVLSSFQMTNETVNIWTHFLPTWYFLWRLLVLAGGPGFRAEPYHWPLLVFLLPTCLYPFASCCAHTFSSMSPRARHICYFLDYGALSLYSLGCAFPYAAYSMPASWLHGRLHQLFVPAAALNSFLCTGLSCYSRWDCAGAGATAVGKRRSAPIMATTCCARCSLVFSSPLTCLSGWHQDALTTLATATSSSTSVQCWAPTSSWKRCWLIWSLAKPGWPHRPPPWAWQAQWPRWAWQWRGTCSSLLPSQPPYFGPLVHAPCCRVVRRRGVLTPNNSKALLLGGAQTQT
uniref:Progestin and adipoQ receptor family member 6 n=1 Tax=Myotis myotis TaxID=51298 RepID=A0A7J7SS08_MYOMY|nr:progestin and adipoQ receptor family member 6 [Myotis myotis]